MDEELDQHSWEVSQVEEPHASGHELGTKTLADRHTLKERR
jgi:hypothetical protein